MQETPPPDEKAGRREGRWMMALRRHGGLALPVAIAAPLLSGGLLAAQAWILAEVLHSAIAGSVPRAEMLPGIAAMAAILALRALLAAVGERAGAGAAERIKHALRQALFARMLSEKPGWTAARPSGALAAALVDQVEALDGFFARFLPAMVQAAFLPVAFAALLLPVDWVVGLLLLVTAPLIPVFMALVGWGAEAAGRAQATALSRLSGLFADRLRGMLALKLFGRAEEETASVRAAGDELRRRMLGMLRIAFLSSAVLEFFAALGVAGVALHVGLTYLGLVDLRMAPLTLQAGLFCLLMAPEVYQPLRLLAAHYHDRASAKAAVSEISALFDGLPGIPARPEVPEPAAPVRNEAWRGLRLEARGLTVRTPDGSRTVLDGTDLAVAAGAHVALLGASGIGKSTLLEALCGLRDHDGAVLLDGRPLEEMDEGTLRCRVAFLGQRPRIFHATIADNIRLGRRGASDGEVRRAAELAEVAGFADGLPRGLDTPLGEGGIGLSGGEAHRVALARIFLRDPALILLDEPTAHLDAATQARVLDNIQAFAAGRTLVVATHAAEVASRMDRAWRIAGGHLLPAPHQRPVRQDGISEGAA